MKKHLLFILPVVLCVACNTNSPEQKQLLGTWSEPYHVHELVKAIIFNEDGTLIYTDKPDTTWSTVIDYAGVQAKLRYSVKENQIYFSGDSPSFTFSSPYSIQDNTLTLDSFAYDGGHQTAFIKPFVLKKQ